MDFADHYTTMSITSFGASVLDNQKAPEKRFVVKKTNDISDIEGASSQSKYAKLYGKPQFQQSDVPGSTPKSLTHSRNCKDLQLYLDDIEGTRHAIKDRMMRTQRHVNPLVPEYPLPTYLPVELLEPKFIRDSLTVSDIDGAQVRVKKEFETRDIMSVSDIVGAQACFRPRHARVRLEAEPHDLMWVTDNMKKKQYTDRTQRVTDLNNPIYTINGMTYQDDPRYSKPKPLPKEVRGNHLLQTHDIDGARPGWGHRERTEFRNLTSTMDIEGAQADTIKQSITTKRFTNCLTPVYQSLDGDGPLYPLIRPIMPADLISEPTLRSAPKNKPAPAMSSSSGGNPMGLPDRVVAPINAPTAVSYADFQSRKELVGGDSGDHYDTIAVTAASNTDRGKVNREMLRLDLGVDGRRSQGSSAANSARSSHREAQPAKSANTVSFLSRPQQAMGLTNSGRMVMQNSSGNSARDRPMLSPKQQRELHDDISAIRALK